VDEGRIPEKGKTLIRMFGVDGRGGSSDLEGKKAARPSGETCREWRSFARGEEARGGRLLAAV